MTKVPEVLMSLKSSVLLTAVLSVGSIAFASGAVLDDVTKEATKFGQEYALEVKQTCQHEAEEQNRRFYFLNGSAEKIAESRRSCLAQYAATLLPEAAIEESSFRSKFAGYPRAIAFVNAKLKNDVSNENRERFQFLGEFADEKASTAVIAQSMTSIRLLKIISHSLK